VGVVQVPKGSAMKRNRKRNPGGATLLVGGVVVVAAVVGGVLLFEKQAKASKGAPAPAPSAPPPVADPFALPALVVNPDGSAHEQGTAFVFNTNDDAASAVAEANARGVTVHQVLLERAARAGQQ